MAILKAYKCVTKKDFRKEVFLLRKGVIYKFKANTKVNKNLRESKERRYFNQTKRLVT